MRYTTFAVFIGVLFAGSVLAQQSATFHRVGDVFRGRVKLVRTERTSFIVEGNQVIESPPTLVTLTTYTADSLSRESTSFNSNGSPRQKTVETYHSDGNKMSVSVFNAQGALISRTSYEQNDGGLPMSETTYNGDGSVKEMKFVQTTSEPRKIVAHTKIAGSGMQIETAVNSSDGTNKRWTYTKPEGSRSVDNHSRDKEGNRITESLHYRTDGVLTMRRVSKVNASTTRLEATEYDGQGNVRRKTLETREYDSHRNLIKLVNYRWNDELQKFEPAAATYHHITYFQ